MEDSSMPAPEFTDGFRSYFDCKIKPVIEEAECVFSPDMSDNPELEYLIKIYKHPSGKTIRTLDMKSLHDYVPRHRRPELFIVPRPDSTAATSVRVVRVDYNCRKDKVTPLAWVAFNGKAKHLKWLLRNGAYTDRQLRNGNTVLMETIFAFTKERQECVRILLSAGARVNIENKDGHTAMTVAAEVGDLDIIKMLLSRKHQYDLEHKTKMGHTALTMAAVGGHIDAVRYLVEECGANIIVEDTRCLTTLCWAHVKSPPVAAYLTVMLTVQDHADTFLKRRLEVLSQNPNDFDILSTFYAICLVFLQVRSIRDILVRNGSLTTILQHPKWDTIDFSSGDIAGEDLPNLARKYSRIQPWIIALTCAMAYNDIYVIDKFLQSDYEKVLKYIIQLAQNSSKDKAARRLTQSALMPFFISEKGRMRLLDSSETNSSLLTYLIDADDTLSNEILVIIDFFKDNFDETYSKYNFNILKGTLDEATKNKVFPRPMYSLKKRLLDAFASFEDFKRMLHGRHPEKEVKEVEEVVHSNHEVETEKVDKRPKRIRKLEEKELREQPANRPRSWETSDPKSGSNESVTNVKSAKSRSRHSSESVSDINECCPVTTEGNESRPPVSELSEISNKVAKENEKALTKDKVEGKTKEDKTLSAAEEFQKLWVADLTDKPPEKVCAEETSKIQTRSDMDAFTIKDMSGGVSRSSSSSSLICLHEEALTPYRKPSVDEINDVIVLSHRVDKIKSKPKASSFKLVNSPVKKSGLTTRQIKKLERQKKRERQHVRHINRSENIKFTSIKDAVSAIAAKALGSKSNTKKGNDSVKSKKLTVDTQVNRLDQKSPKTTISDPARKWSNVVQDGKELNKNRTTSKDQREAKKNNDAEICTKMDLNVVQDFNVVQPPETKSCDVLNNADCKRIATSQEDNQSSSALANLPGIKDWIADDESNEDLYTGENWSVNLSDNSSERCSLLVSSQSDNCSSEISSVADLSSCEELLVSSQELDEASHLENLIQKIHEKNSFPNIEKLAEKIKQEENLIQKIHEENSFPNIEKLAEKIEQGDFYFPSIHDRNFGNLNLVPNIVSHVHPPNAMLVSHLEEKLLCGDDIVQENSWIIDKSNKPNEKEMKNNDNNKLDNSIEPISFEAAEWEKANPICSTLQQLHLTMTDDQTNNLNQSHGEQIVFGDFDASLSPTLEKRGKTLSDIEDSFFASCAAFSTPANVKSAPPGFSEVTLSQIISWKPNSCRWRQLYEMMVGSPMSRFTVNGPLYYEQREEYCLSKGSLNKSTFLGINKDGVEIVIKCLEKQHGKAVIDTIKMMRQGDLVSPNILKYKGFSENDTQIFLEVGLCEYNLEDYLREVASGASMEDISAELCRQLLNGLAGLHRVGILHMNLKPSNVLIDSAGSIRLADYGIPTSVQCSQEDLSETNLCWKPLEMLSEEGTQEYSKASDIQVAGMLLHYMMTGKHPYGKNYKTCEENISANSPDLSPITNQVFANLMTWMLHPDVAWRKSAKTCLTHPFFWSAEKMFTFLKLVSQEPEMAMNATDKDEVYEALEQAQGWMELEKNSMNPVVCKILAEKDIIVKSMGVKHVLKAMVFAQDKFKSWPNGFYPLIVKSPQAMAMSHNPMVFFLTHYSRVFIGVYDIISHSTWRNRAALSLFFDQGQGHAVEVF